MRKKINKTFTIAIATIGFISAILGIWAFVYNPTPDNEITLVKESIENITISRNTDFASLKNPIIANKITIDSESIILPKGTVLIANEIELKNGGEITGDSITIIATLVEGGRISGTMARESRNGGDLIVAAAMINGTAIESNGANGQDGMDGNDGKNGGTGEKGQDGKCGGSWRKAKPGGPGGNGSDGKPGQHGEAGGDAGNIMILTSYELTIQPLAEGGTGGNGGRGGAPGRGGPGGRGGSGCTGFGGSQDGKPNGANGIDGKMGKKGRSGANGQTRKPTIKIVSFSLVKESIRNNNDPEKVISAIRGIRPKNS